MKKLLLLFPATVFSLFAFAQDFLSNTRNNPACAGNIVFQPDSVTLPHQPTVQDLDRLYPQQPNILFEFRLYEVGLHIQSQTAFIMMLDSARQWHVRYFSHKNANNQMLAGLTEQQVAQAKAGSLWCVLRSLHLLSLPDAGSIRSRLISYTLDTTSLPWGNRKMPSSTDGMYYFFSLQSPNAKRSYGYGNPHTLLKQYSNVEELYNVSAIIAVIKKYLGLPAIVY